MRIAIVPLRKARDHSRRARCHKTRLILRKRAVPIPNMSLRRCAQSEPAQQRPRAASLLAETREDAVRRLFHVLNPESFLPTGGQIRLANLARAAALVKPCGLCGVWTVRTFFFGHIQMIPASHE